MNQIIINLYEQASEIASADEFATRSYRDRVLETFAKLIVRECAEVAGCNGHVSGFALGDLIKEHFGVEE